MLTRRGADCLRVGERASARKDGHPPEKHLFGVVQQSVAPLNGRSQGLVADGPIARAACQQFEPIAQPAEERLRRQEFDARGGELNCQGQAIQPSAYIRHSGRVRVGNLKIRAGSLSALDE